MILSWENPDSLALESVGEEDIVVNENDSKSQKIIVLNEENMSLFFYS